MKTPLLRSVLTVVLIGTGAGLSYFATPLALCGQQGTVSARAHVVEADDAWEARRLVEALRNELEREAYATGPDAPNAAAENPARLPDLERTLATSTGNAATSASGVALRREATTEGARVTVANLAH